MSPIPVCRRLPTGPHGQQICVSHSTFSRFRKFNTNPQMNADHTLLLYNCSRKCCLQVPSVILATPLVLPYQKICLWSPGG